MSWQDWLTYRDLFYYIFSVFLVLSFLALSFFRKFGNFWQYSRAGSSVYWKLGQQILREAAERRALGDHAPAHRGGGEAARGRGQEVALPQGWELA